MTLQTKYGFNITTDVLHKSIIRMTNQLWKLIPMRENDENWKRQLELVIVEIAGLNEIFIAPHFLQLLSKLEGLRVQETDFELYRKTVFESISLFQELSRGIRL